MSELHDPNAGRLADQAMVAVLSAQGSVLGFQDDIHEWFKRRTEGVWIRFRSGSDAWRGDRGGGESCDFWSGEII